MQTESHKDRTNANVYASNPSNCYAVPGRIRDGSAGPAELLHLVVGAEDQDIVRGGVRMVQECMEGISAFMHSNAAQSQIAAWVTMLGDTQKAGAVADEIDRYVEQHEIERPRGSVFLDWANRLKVIAFVAEHGVPALVVAA